MPQKVQRWTEVAPSQFTHQAEGLSIARAIFPDQPPFRAWSNFEFRDGRSKRRSSSRSPCGASEQQKPGCPAAIRWKLQPNREGKRMNDALATTPQRYALSFTTGALLTREASLLAPVYLEQRDWDQVRELGVRHNVLQTRTHTGGVRLVREVVQRLAVLTDDEVQLLTDATVSERASLMWAAACRRYDLIGEFAEEVLRERFLVHAPTLGYEDFNSFWHSKALWHEELAKTADSTLQRLRRNVFKMLREAELLSNAGEIMPAVLSERVAAVLSADLRFFPMRQESGQ